MDEQAGRGRIHASCVAFGGRGVLILGAAGSGKSALALELMALGAALVADDQVDLTRAGNALIASAPPAIRGRIEARFVGILNAAPLDSAPVALAIQRDIPEAERLPPRRSKTWLGTPVPLLHNTDSSHFAAAILQYLKGGRSD